MTSKEPIQINSPAVLFSSLMVIALWCTVAAIAQAIGAGSLQGVETISNAKSVINSLVATLALLVTFFAGGYLSCIAAQARNVFASLLHSLSTWAVMAIVLIGFLFSVVAAIETKSNLNDMKSATLVTNVELLKGVAVTSLREPGPHNLAKEQSRAEKNATGNMMAYACWVTVLSVLLGAGAASAGGLLAVRQARW